MHTKIKIIIDGQEVEGEITHRSASDINVKITKPYKEVSRGLHIPCFARSCRSFDSKLGDEIAKDLLKSIYHLCEFTIDNLDSLTRQYCQSKKRIKCLEADNISGRVFKSKRLQLRELLKSGQIDNVEYQKLLTPIRKANEKFELEKNLIWNRFFEENFPTIVPADTRNDVLSILENNVRTAD